MRSSKAAFLLTAVPIILCAQTNAPSAFRSQLAQKYSQLATSRSLTLTGMANWTAGSLHESGSATFVASTDDSATIDLRLRSASRKETANALGNSRVCQWTDARSMTHELVGPDCDASVPWFAPFLMAQPAAAIGNYVTVTDDGLVTRKNSQLHELSYRTLEHGKNATESQALTDQTCVHVFYDPQTFLPITSEFTIHPDGDLGRQIPVRVVYSNYQIVSGLPIPFQIDRYVNGMLQLSITLTDASLN